MADGRIDASELKAQEDRVAALMKTVEPELTDELHEQVTHLLCELSAYNIMQTIHQLVESARRPSSGDSRPAPIPRIRRSGEAIARIAALCI